MEDRIINDLIDSRVNEILDKIAKYGILTITILEKDFMDIYSLGIVSDTIKRLELLNNAFTYDDDNFKFELKETIVMIDETYYIGTLYVPELVFSDGLIVEGNLEGKIISFNNGTYALEFDKNIQVKKKKIRYEVYDFCWGLEYELDNFIDYIIQELI